MITLLLLACTPDAELGIPDPPAPPSPPVPEVTEPFAPEVAAVLDERAPDFALESAEGIFHLGAHEGDVIFIELAGFT